MKVETLHIGMSVRHPQYGVGIVKSLTEHLAEVQFADGKHSIHPETSGLEPAEPQAELKGLTLPVSQLIRETVDTCIDQLGLEKPNAAVSELGPRWRKGKLAMHPSDPTLQVKTIELDVFFHKIVMMRNNLRVLEQKINADEKLTAAEKIDWQQYITRCYGSMTTFNLLFKEKEGQF